jgi:hypothetical protein
MCGRFTLTVSKETIADFFGLADVPELAPRYNIAPTQQVLALTASDQGRRLAWYRWGLVPSWAADPSIGNKLINARADGVEQPYCLLRQECFGLPFPRLPQNGSLPRLAFCPATYVMQPPAAIQRHDDFPYLFTGHPGEAPILRSRMPPGLGRAFTDRPQVGGRGVTAARD